MITMIRNSNNSTNFTKPGNHLSPKKKTTIYGVVNPDPYLAKALKCGGFQYAFVQMDKLMIVNGKIQTCHNQQSIFSSLRVSELVIVV